MNRSKTWLALLLTLSLLINLVVVDLRSYSADPKEVTNLTSNWKTSLIYLKQGGENAIVKEGVVQDVRPALHRNAEVRLEYKFDIPVFKNGTSGTSLLAPGDYIDIPLPSGHFLTFPDGLHNLNYKGTKVAEYRFIEMGGADIIRVTFLETILEKDEYEGVNIAIKAQFVRNGDDFEFPLFPNSANTDRFTTAIATEVTHLGFEKWYTFPLIKDFYTDQNRPDEVIWRLLVNTDKVEQLTKSKDITRVQKSSDVLVVDHIPPGTTVEEVGLKVSMFMTTPKINPSFPNQPEGELSWSAGGNFDISDMFRKIDIDSSGITLEEFKQQLILAGKQQAKPFPVWGIYETQTNNVTSQIFVAWMGDSPNSNWTYEDMYQNSSDKRDHAFYPDTLAGYFDQEMRYLAPEQIARLKEVYTSSNGGNPVPVVSWTISLRNRLENGKYGHYYNHALIKSLDSTTPMLYKTEKLFNHVSTDSSIDSAEKVKLSLTVKKEWIGTAETSAFVQLYGDNEPLGSPIELNEDNAWRWTFRGLDKYGKNKEIKYEIREVNLHAEYDVSYREENVDAHNTVLIASNKRLPNTETTSVAVEKKWKGEKTNKVYIILFADGKERERTILSEDNQWKHTFSTLPKYNESNIPFEYTVEEVPVDGYDVEISKEVLADGTTKFLVTNTKKAGSATPDPRPNPLPDPEPDNGGIGGGNSGGIGGGIGGAKDEDSSETTTTTTTSTQNATLASATSTSTSTAGTTSATTATSTSGATAATTAALNSGSQAGQGTDQAFSGAFGSDSAESYIQSTTRDPLFDIDDDDAARGNAKRKKKGEPGYEEDDEGIPAGTLPTTGNLPNELFYAVGAFVCVLGLLILMLQKLKL